MTSTFAYDVFLSHNSEDKQRVRQLAERLREAGVRVWLDDWVIRPGDDIYLAIERGLQTTRVLVLCMSPAALGSNWVGLERNTVLFRDPTNEGRRFIPLLLADCDLPDTLRRYKHVDYRRETDGAFEELLSACLPRTEPPSPPGLRESDGKAGPAKPNLDHLVSLERTIRDHSGLIYRVVFAPDGSWAASASRDGTVKIWDVETGACRGKLGRLHDAPVLAVAIAKDGGTVVSASQDETLSVWDLPPRLRSQVLTGHSAMIRGVALTDGGRAVSASYDRSVRVFDLNTGEIVHVLDGHQGDVNAVAAIPGTQLAVSGSDDTTLIVWDAGRGKRYRRLTGHSDKILAVACPDDGRNVLSAGRDRTIKIWDWQSGKCVGTLEGHTGSITDLAVASEADLIASVGYSEKRLKIWDLLTGDCLHTIDFKETPVSVAFNADGSRLIVGTDDARLYFYRFSRGSIGRSAARTRRYVNAKVVVVGESGVGKSGLAHRLIEDRFVQTHSTHGMQVWRLDLPLEPSENMEREALLWDLAGQEDYRLIHQLFLDETALALVLFNPQDNDPFLEVGTWLKVLAATIPEDDAREVTRLLIAARTDVGGVKVSQRKIDRFLAEHHIAGYLPTSALTGENCSDRRNGGKPSALKELIASHISWRDLPWTSTPRLLAELKNALIAMTESKSTRLLRFAELAQRLEQALPDEKFGASDVRTAVTLLANHGLVLPLKFGDLVLLRPELFNGYAAAVIRAARAHTDEIGSVEEQAVLGSTIDLEGVERLEHADEQLLMRALVQTFLDKSLCIAEDTPAGRHLVFPSQFRRDRPIPSHPEIFVSYTFSGEWQKVYTTLVVRLWYSREFQHTELWHNAAEFQTSKGHAVGLVMEALGEGEGTVSVFFETGVPDELKVIFIEYVHRHLEKYASGVRRDRRYVCPSCAKPVTDIAAVRERLENGKDFIYCVRCDERVPLIDHIEQRLVSDPVARKVLKMDETATRGLESQALGQILHGHLMAICAEANQIFRNVDDAAYGIHGVVEFKDNDGVPSGTKIYVHLKSDDSFLRTRRSGAKTVLQASNPQAVEHWADYDGDVYVVIRGANETIRWMNASSYLTARPDKESIDIIFEGRKLDAPEVWRVRDTYFKR